MENVLFTHYAMIVKNLRGVLLFKTLSEDVVGRIKWLVNRFKYRNIGVPPSYFNLESVEGVLNKKIFRKLYYPVDEILLLKNMFVESGLEELFIESVIMASIYISPLMLLSREYLDLVEKYSIGRVSTCREMSISDWKLHMRISDYTILDFYEEMVTKSIDYVRNIHSVEERKKILENRVKIVERDYKRYWRIICSNGDTYQYYLDPLLIIEENPGQYSRFLSEKHASALSVIPVINLTIVDKQ